MEYKYLDYIDIALPRRQGNAQNTRDIRRIRRRPLVRRALTGSLTVGEVRDELLSFLRETGALKVCAQCKRRDSRGRVVGCCAGCRNHRYESGCQYRNTACLTFFCGGLRRYLLKKRAFLHFTDLGRVFGWLDDVCRRKYPADAVVRIEVEALNGYPIAKATRSRSRRRNE